METYLCAAPPTLVGMTSKGGKRGGGGAGAGAWEGAGGGGGGAATSLPVNILDWPKILGVEYSGKGSASADVTRWPLDECGDEEFHRGRG
uniref:Uncharacterized protein n=1 Tax=Oryza barthii TaxID=65489 RepID=A0A0D3HUU1_9ORYZ